MDQIELIRQKLYKAMDNEDINLIIQISQELDKLILHYMQGKK